MFRNHLSSCFLAINGQQNAVIEINEQLLGQFKDDKRNGKGTCYYADGRKYTGDMVNDKREGQGVLVWKDGERYEVRCSEITCHHVF
jgi:hypothetical protein